MDQDNPFAPAADHLLPAHTPGPWAIDAEAGAIFHAASGARVAVIGDGVARIERDANARLIAAAPELLAALRELVHSVSVDPGTGDGTRTFAEHGRAAIAKAEGRS